MIEMGDCGECSCETLGYDNVVVVSGRKLCILMGWEKHFEVDGGQTLVDIAVLDKSF